MHSADMDAQAIANDALRALQASLRNERDWKNIQRTVQEAIGRVVAVLVAQTQRVETIHDRLTSLEASCGQNDRDARLDAIREEVAVELKDSMQCGHDQLTERVCSHVDARLKAQTEFEHARWAEWAAADERKRRGELEALRAELSKEVQVAAEEAKRANMSVQDPKTGTMERQLKRLEKHVQNMENKFIGQWNAWQDEVAVSLALKAAHEDLPRLIEGIIDDKLATTSEALHQVEAEAQRIHEGLNPPSQTMTDYVNTTEEMIQLKSHMHELIGIVETLQGEQTSLKALVVNHVQNGDMQSDMKRSVARLHDAVKNVRQSVEKAAKRAEVEALNEQVAMIHKQLRSEIYQARYIWKEGRPSAKRTIPWTTQVVNSNCDVFLWQRSTSDLITAMVPGLYHLQAAFFTSFEPTLQVLVNGEPALIRTSIAPRETSSKDENELGEFVLEPKQRRLHHTAGDLVGVEISAFLALPARAVISICYDIDERAQGFVNIRKL